MTMTLISTVTVGSGGTSAITFSSIPATGTDLLITSSIRTNTGSTRQTLPITFNGATTTFVYRNIYGTGSSVASGTGNRYVITVNGNGSNGSTFGNSSMYIYNYANSSPKVFSVESVTETMTTGGFQELLIGSWNGTSAINSISIQGDGQTILQDSVVSLYTITKGSGGATVNPN